MKSGKRIIALALMLVMIINCSNLGAFRVLAHSSVLNVEYDACIPDDNLKERWYVIDHPTDGCYHISHEVQTIKYYFADNPESGYGWDDVPDGAGDEIKSSYAESMKKWNNVYVYLNDSAGNVIKNKVINIVEGTLTDHNLIIYPTNDVNDSMAHAEIVSGSEETIERTNTINHYHSSEWFMTINVDYFYVHGNRSAADVNILRDRTGAHEIGHILGLRDIDSFPLCGDTGQSAHHKELLMGYGWPISERQSNITYKDIAGVAITRGFHTDSDHKWLYAGLDTNGKYKLICSICNGVKYVESLSGYAYNTYNACGGNHTLSSGNMMAVASYGTSDYYKCKYCRYVAPFENIVAQNYTMTYDNTYHIYTNNVEGLEYSVYEEHAFIYFAMSSTQHTAMCSCGYQREEQHQLYSLNARYMACRKCPYTRDNSGGIEEGVMKTEEETEIE